MSTADIIADIMALSTTNGEINTSFVKFIF